MPQKKKKVGQRSLFLLLLLTAVIASVVVIFILRGRPLSEAAKGGGGKPAQSPASIVLNQTNVHLGDTVTFTTSGGSRIALACYQGGLNMVYSADQATGTSFLLGGTSSKWLSSGGEALCYAWLYARDLSKGFLASTSFTAAGAR